jgi:hypothetical protein
MLACLFWFIVVRPDSPLFDLSFSACHKKRHIPLSQLYQGKLKSAEEMATEAYSALDSFNTVLATHMVEAYLILVTVFVKLSAIESEKQQSAVWPA